MSEETKNDEFIISKDEMIDDMVDVVRCSMRHEIVGVIIEETLASLLKIPVDDVKAVVKNKILENINEASKFLKQSLTIRLRRKDNGWYGKVIGDDVDLEEYMLIDVGSDKSIHGRTPIQSDGTINISDRDPPYDGDKILWNFAIYKHDIDYVIYATDFTFPSEDDTLKIIVSVI